MKKLILIAAFITGAIVQGYSQKLAHANFEEIVTMLPERATAEKEIQDLQKTLEGRLQTMISTYQTKLAEFQEQGSTMSQTMRTSAEGELTDLQRRIQEFQQTAYTDIEAKQTELMGKMFERVRTAATAVGKTGEYTYIFDSSNGTVLYAAGEDITSKIKTELGL
jgi:outer membrane protein